MNYVKPAGHKTAQNPHSYKRDCHWVRVRTCMNSLKSTFCYSLYKRVTLYSAVCCCCRRRSTVMYKYECM